MAGKSLIQGKVYKPAINIMGEAVSGMDIELEQKDNKIQFFEDKRVIPDSKGIEEMNRLGFKKILCEERKLTRL